MARAEKIEIHPVRTARDHARALQQIERLWGARPGSPEAETLELLVTLVDAYETKRHPIEAPDPIQAIRFRMEQEGLSRADLEKLIGSRARVSEVLNGKRPLTVAMIRRLREGLGISAEIRGCECGSRLRVLHKRFGEFAFQRHVGRGAVPRKFQVDIGVLTSRIFRQDAIEYGAAPFEAQAPCRWQIETRSRDRRPVPPVVEYVCDKSC